MPTNHKKVNRTRKVIRKGKKMSTGGSRKINRTRKVVPRNKKVGSRSRKIAGRSRKMRGGKLFDGKPKPKPKPPSSKYTRAQFRRYFGTGLRNQGPVIISNRQGGPVRRVNHNAARKRVLYEATARREEEEYASSSRRPR